MSLRIDFALQNLLGAGNGNGGHLAAQRFAYAVGFLLDFGRRGSELPLAFLDAIGLALGNDLVGACLRLVDDRRSLFARLGDDAIGLGLRLVEALLAAFCGCQPVRDLFLTILDGGHDRWPDELHAEPDKHDHRDRLADEGHMNIQVMLLTSLTS